MDKAIIIQKTEAARNRIQKSRDLAAQKLQNEYNRLRKLRKKSRFLAAF